MPSRKGKPNKAKQDFRSRLQAYCTRHQVDPFFAMVKMLADPALEPTLHFACAKELAQYLQPKLRSVVLSGDPQQPIEIVHRYGREPEARSREPA
jgi:hypothetical protein